MLDTPDSIITVVLSDTPCIVDQHALVGSVGGQVDVVDILEVVDVKWGLVRHPAEFKVGCGCGYGCSSDRANEEQWE